MEPEGRDGSSGGGGGGAGVAGPVDANGDPKNAAVLLEGVGAVGGTGAGDVVEDNAFCNDPP